ncbi:unnamed protein product [Phytomonas sp. EM1]|nr:unnamed protein product [Phytomonas sp. EM1]|eukprot:CCW61290.1 unnamed protein product [Phytomonas sp. isolate EM1]
MRRCVVAFQRRAAALFASSPISYRSNSFRPFTEKDEDDLVRVVKTKPHHVLKHVRQQVWRSRRREVHFRNTVTQLMIILQEFLRKQMIDPAHASQIIEGVLEECVTYSQHDMAHLLFRAFLRFRKYGCVISVNAIRHLFESYKTINSAELMLQLAQEMKSDVALRPLCAAAYLFANDEAAADALREGLSLVELPKEDILALVAGYDHMGKTEKLFEILDSLKDGAREPAEKAEVYGALLRVFHRRNDDASFTRVLQSALEAKAPLDNATFSVILRRKLRGVASAEEIESIEEELKENGYVPDITGNSIIITAYARLIRYGDHGSDELMLSKVDMLLSSIESRLKEGDPDMDISAAHIRSIIRGYGAAGRPESIKNAWSKLQFKGLTDDVGIYNEMLKWFALMGSVKDVLALKEEMEREGVRPDSTTYTWILRALGKFYPRHVEEISKELETRRVRPNIYLYNTLIGIWGDLQQFDRVASLLDEMRKREESSTLQFTAITFAVLIRVYSKDVAKSEELYAEAKKRNFADHPHVQTSMLHVYATDALTSNHENGKLEKLLAEIPSWSIDVYNVLLNLYGRQKNREKFEATLQKLENDAVSMNDVTFGTLITAFARWGEVARVDQTIALVRAHHGEVTATFYSVLASSLSRMGQTGGVQEAWEDLLASRLFPGTAVYNQFLTLYSRQADLARMQGVLDSMMAQVPPNPVTATTVLDLLGKSGQVAEMEALFADMKANTDTQPTAVTYHQVMNAYAKSGEVEKMEKIHEEYLQKGFTDSAVTNNILLDGYGRARDLVQMEEVLQKRQADGIPLDDFTYCVMVNAYGRVKSEKGVIRLFDQVSDPANASAPSKRVVWSCLDAFCRCGNTEYMEKAIQLLQSANADNKLLPSDSIRLISYYCRAGLMEKVEELEKELTGRDEALSYSALNTMARGYARVGRFDKTVEVLHQLRDRNLVPDASTTLHLSGAFLKAGLHEQAKQVIEWRRQYAKLAESSKAVVEGSDDL